MAQFERDIQAAVDAQDIPGCVLFATNRDGITPYPPPILCSRVEARSTTPKPLDQIQ